jgi:hypothetical protein
MSFFSKQVLFLAFRIAQHIVAKLNIYIASPPGKAFLIQLSYCSYEVGLSLCLKLKAITSPTLVLQPDT